MMFEPFGKIKGGEDGITLKLIDDAAVALYGLGDRGKILVERGDELHRGEAFADGGEAFEIREQNRRLTHLAVAGPDFMLG